MNREKEVYKVTLWGSAVNVVLVVFKFVAGIVGHSSAMIADAVHSVSDFATDLIVLAFVRISHKPKDKSHDYGHGKFETLATTLIGIALFAVAVGIFIGTLVFNEPFTLNVALGVALILFAILFMILTDKKAK